MNPTPDDLMPGTQLESVEDILRGLPPPAGSAAERTPTLLEPVRAPGPTRIEQARASQDATPFRPVRRPPMALLCIMDDGDDDGEWVRLRKDKLVIGRTHGDVRIPHETMMSGQHAEISRQAVGQGFRWYLIDLQSTNGSFVRAARMILTNGTEFMIGSGLFRFDAGQAAGTTEINIAENAAAAVLPSLVQVTAQGLGRRFLLNAADNWIGRDAARCSVALEDPLLNARHARLCRDAQGQWALENAGSRNGVWLRIKRVPVERSCLFQLGEQRFLLRVL
jgi:pSer/pThr/pTyr-binding forkhead associated (FHA) protein